jgi:hypothetical protein
LPSVLDICSSNEWSGMWSQWRVGNADWMQLAHTDVSTYTYNTYMVTNSHTHCTQLNFTTLLLSFSPAHSTLPLVAIMNYSRQVKANRFNKSRLQIDSTSPQHFVKANTAWHGCEYELLYNTSVCNASIRVPYTLARCDARGV